MLSTLRTQLVRVAENAVAGFYTFTLCGGDGVVFLFILYLLWTPLYFLPFFYLVWRYFDRMTPYQAGRRFECVRRLSMWKYLRNYFPINFHKTVDLDPTRNYMFCFHPHGLLAFSCFVNFSTEATDFSKKFPGLTIHPLSLNIIFYVPLLREFAMAHGMGSVSKESINYKLTKLGQGHSVVIVPGGVADVELTDPNHPYRCKIKNRLGFIREALMTGSPLVPVFSFGESEVLHNIVPSPSSLFGLICRFSRWACGGAPLHLRGDYPLLPIRKQIDVIVGSPLEIPKISNPNDDEIN